ncbi:DUF3169 family protein [Streptococcus himalayensis]|uniref:Membrane protein n=1 Tax=Streptococcus himalayensis TaxID=1888195 RepID=A0A917EEJ5_9STRE|nr:DUF3169 family protein [Streptococcus himalayensis]GGE25659.1 membrane protein [Streptococcus himalayensis]
MKKSERLKYFSKFFLLGLFVGIFGSFLAGFIVGYTGDYLSFDNLKGSLLWLSRVFLIFIVCVGCHLLDSAKKDYRYYTENELEDDDYSKWYRGTFISLEYATIAFNIAEVLSMLNLLLGMKLLALEKDFSFDFDWIDIIILVSLGLLKHYLYKVTSMIREHRISTFPTIQEMKEYIYSYDEGEKESVFENSFLILFQLNQRVLPLTYIALLVISMMTGEIQILAYLVVAFIHVYINVKQYQRVRNYFK